MATCEAKSTWRKRRSRDIVIARPSNLSERVDRIMELVDDDYPYASSSVNAMININVDLSDACGVRDSDEGDEVLGPIN
jgi:hypothetical protein